MTRQETSRLKNAMQNHDYVARKQLTEWESINRKINNREDFEKFIQIYSIYLDVRERMAKLWINKNELHEFQQQIS